LFDGEFLIVQSRVLKEKHLKLVLKLFVSGQQNEDSLFDAIQFNSSWVDKSLPQKVRVAYRPSINDFRGKRNIQLMVDYMELA